MNFKDNKHLRFFDKFNCSKVYTLLKVVKQSESIQLIIPRHYFQLELRIILLPVGYKKCVKINKALHILEF